MTIFWSFKDIPELSEMPKKEAKKIWLRCYLKSFRNWQTWTALAIGGCCAALGGIIGQTISDTNIGYYIGIFIGANIGWQIAGRILTKMIVLHIREYLKSHDQVCPD